MGKSKGRRKPSDPQAIMLARAREREVDRAQRKDPGRWGIANDILDLPANKPADGDGVQVHQGSGRREVHAKRLDPFQSLAQRGALTPAQHHAAMRLWGDWCEQHGIRTDDPKPVLEVIDRPQRGPGDLVNARMIDAGRRFDQAIRLVGPVHGAMLKALLQPKVMCGSVIIWRAEVERVTGVSDRNVQGPAVCLACESLRQVYEELDAERARQSRPLHPFSTCEIEVA